MSLFALPTLHGEPCGGHIHISFFVRGELLDRCGKAASGLGFSNFQSALGSGGDSNLMEYEQLGLHPANEFGRTLDHLMIPFEFAVQPWFSRERRNGAYGRSGDVRDQVGTFGRRASTTKRVSAYYHYEYRLPSTWLIHPTLAYSYLALAKLLVVNWPSYRKTMLADLTRQAAPTGPRPHNKEWAKILSTRMETVWGNLTTIPPDCAQVRQAISACMKLRGDWYRAKGVDVAAWRKLLE